MEREVITMTKYQVKLTSSTGEDSYEDELYDTREEAEEAGAYACSCYHQGYEILNMSNPYENPASEEEDLDYEIIGVED